MTLPPSPWKSPRWELASIVLPMACVGAGLWASAGLPSGEPPLGLLAGLGAAGLSALLLRFLGRSF